MATAPLSTPDTSYDLEYTIDIEENNEDYGYTHGIAGAVLDAFEIEYRSRSYSPGSNAAVGGALPGMDIKSYDAMGVIKASLLESFAGRLYTLPVDIMVDPEDGRVEFFEIGTFSATVTDIYQVIQNVGYQQQVGGCVVTGKKPIPYRRIENKINMLADSYIYNMTMYNTDCIFADEYDLQASIVYKDPLYMYDDLWYSSGWGSLRGHIHTFEGPDDESFIIRFNDSSTVPQHISDGFPSKVYVVTPTGGDDPPSSPEEAECIWYDSFTSGANTLLIKPQEAISQKNTRQGNMTTFEGLADLYLIGRGILDIKEVPLKCGDSTDSNSGTCAVTYLATQQSVVRLSAGQQYAVKNEEDGARVQFISKMPGYLEYGRDTPFFDVIRQVMQQSADIFPLGDGSAIMVDYTMATLDLNLPSILVASRKKGAWAAAKRINYYVSNLVIYDEPAPVAINGVYYDMEDMQPHRAINNPPDYVYEIDAAMSAMDQGSVINVELGTLGISDCEYLSETIYEMMLAEDGVTTEYMCGPLCDPQLGGVGPGGGIINSISYKYQDESSYLIYVSEGSPLSGMSGINTPRRLATEDVSLIGRVVSKPSGGTVKVYIEKFGSYKALIAGPMHLRVGDLVNVTLFNYPREHA